MTNREKLIKTNIYDLLCEAQANMNNRLDCECVLDYFNGGYIACMGDSESCDSCIEQWLNEEAK